MGTQGYKYFGKEGGPADHTGRCLLKRQGQPRVEAAADYQSQADCVGRELSWVKEVCLVQRGGLWVEKEAGSRQACDLGEAQYHSLYYGQ
jgi:hypothetical protein